MRGKCWVETRAGKILIVKSTRRRSKRGAARPATPPTPPTPPTHPSTRGRIAQCVVHRLRGDGRVLVALVEYLCACTEVGEDVLVMLDKTMPSNTDLGEGFRVLCDTFGDERVKGAIETIYPSAEARKDPFTWLVVCAVLAHEREKRATEALAAATRQGYLAKVFEEQLW